MDIQPPTVLGSIHESPSMTIFITPPVSDTPSTTSNVTDADTSTDTSTRATPVLSGTHRCHFCSRTRSQRDCGRSTNMGPTTVPCHRLHRTRQLPTVSPSGFTDVSAQYRDGDVDMDHNPDADETSRSSEGHGIQSQRTRRAVGIVSDPSHAAALEVNADAHIVINDAHGGVVGGDRV